MHNLRRTMTLASAAAAFLIATPLMAQDFRLDLFLVAREVSGPQNAPTIQDIGGTQDSRETVRPQTLTGNVVNAAVGSTYRVELRYRIKDLVADDFGSRGLSIANISFNTTFDGPAPTAMRRSDLSAHQFDGSTILDPDATGLAQIVYPGTGPATGLIGEFRGWLAADSDPLNGVPTPSSNWLIQPFAVTAPNHNSWRASGTQLPNPGNTDANGQLWGIYAFDFVYNGGQVSFSASALVEPLSGNRFGFFRRRLPSDDPFPQSSNLATDGMITFVPAPGSIVGLALTALYTIRRRR
jgi:hypothetical protein